jgi:hypothetical protein
VASPYTNWLPRLLFALLANVFFSRYMQFAVDPERSMRLWATGTREIAELYN